MFCDSEKQPHAAVRSMPSMLITITEKQKKRFSNLYCLTYHNKKGAHIDLIPVYQEINLTFTVLVHSSYFRVSFSALVTQGAAGALKQVLEQLTGGPRYVSVK